jgi:MYXO-CTERM domain-containing protein
VAWAENADGTMIQEPTGKGLSANPGGYNSPTPFTTLTGLETPVDNQWPANPQTDPATTSFGNNIGFYRQVLYVKGADASVAAHGATGKGSSALTAAPSLTRGKIEAISMGEGGIEPARVELGESVHVHATLHNTDEPMEIANVYFYDGDPARGGKAFDIDRVPYVDATHDTRVEVRYTPKTCGTHDIYVQASHHGKRGTASKVETVEVECGSTPAPEKDDGGGCTIASVGQTSSALGWLAPLGAIGAALGIRRRQRKG